MSDFSDYDPTAANEMANEWQGASNGLWDTSITLDQVATELWLDGNTTAAMEFSQLSDRVELYSHEAYEASWDAYYGPVNSEGYTAHDAALGYTSTDTSFIEPASSAGSMSMISDYTGDSSL